ncbi:MAG: sigma 54-interacting transcriptional regulator, partial [Planctomycetota bacterium]|nr:sigma 54-interacting transcriptional regulator [Planctomycetota bacterium]
MAYLIIRSGPLAGRRVKLGGSAFRIGRDPSCSLSLGDGKASRVHAEIAEKDGAYVIRDLKSSNGTKVNGREISAITLSDGDRIEIGETEIEFRAGSAEVPAGTGRVEAGERSVDATALRVAEGGGWEESRNSGAGGGPAGTEEGGAEAGRNFETLRIEDISLLRAPPRDTTRRAPGKVAPPAVPETDRLADALHFLVEVGKACSESRWLDELFAVLADRLAERLEADRVVPIVAEGASWRPSRPPSGPGGKKFGAVPLSKTIVEHALSTRLAVLTNPGEDERFADAASVSEQGIRSALCVPIASGGDLLGLIYADRLGGEPFSRYDLEVASAAALQAAPAVRNLLRLEREISAKERLAGELRSRYNILGESEAIRSVLRFIERAAPTKACVLILGESGTGKELVARAIHYRSARADEPFVVVNCAALSETLVESELFGHAKGAFTGATGEREGRFEAADGGTIFLDEVGELPLNIQTKLLRVLEQGEISRVGETRVRTVDVRVIAATNRDLEAEVTAGRFRQDLFYRLNVLRVKLPPLRERGGDAELLLDRFLAEFARACGRPALRLTDRARRMLLAYRWPGNVREMRNVVERLVVLASGDEIGVEDLPPEIASGAGATVAPHAPGERIPAALGERVAPDGRMAHDAGEAGVGGKDAHGARGWKPRPLAEVEREHIMRVLEYVGGNKKQAAEILGIDRSTLYARLRAYGLGGEAG